MNLVLPNDMRKLLAITPNISLTKLLLASTSTLAFLYLLKIWRSYSFFKDRGLKTPPYRFFFGNFPEIRKDKKMSEVFRDWTDKYGKTYGVYVGHLPYIITSDLSFINEICIKQYNNFSAKKRQPLDEEDDAPRVMIINAVGGRWKRMRNIMNPTFSSSKMKELCPLMQICVGKLMQKIENNLDQEIDVMSLFKKFTMDTIWNCGFGINKDIQNSSLGDLYIKNSDESLQLLADFTLKMYLAVYLSEVRKYIVQAHLSFNRVMKRLFGEKFVDPLFWIREEVIEIVETRQRQNIKKRDYLGLLMDAYSKKVEAEAQENQRTNFSQIYLDKKLSLEEIKMNLSIFLMAGSESTSITLATLLHVLASLPEEQEKLMHEIDEHYPPGSDIQPDSENIHELVYLDYIIKETLRMWPVANAACTRRCVNATTVNGIDIPQDLTVIIDVLSIHYDPELWGPVDPNVFYPSRFAAKRHPLAWLAFGAGPRNCIGIKFAMLELKMALVNIFKRFEARTCSNTVEKLDFIEGVIGILTHQVNLVFTKRKFDMED